METTRLTVTTEEAGQRADSLLARRLEGLTRSAAARLLEEGRVTDRGRPVAKNLRVQPGQVLEVTLPEPEEPEARPQDIPLDVVYEDEDVIVVNKPTGMVVHPAPGHPDGTLVNALLYHCGESLSGVGLIIAAKTTRPTWPLPASGEAMCRRWRSAWCSSRRRCR